MPIAQSLLAEFEAQAPITRRFLERVPAAKLTWKPHEKSMTTGQLAYHIAVAPGRFVVFVKNNPAPAPDFGRYPQPASCDEILKAFDESLATVRSELPKFDDPAMLETWRMMAGERAIFAQPRAEILRDIMFSHIYQHRGQLSVYLRLLDVAVPSSWGPSADELPVFSQTAPQAA